MRGKTIQRGEVLTVLKNKCAGTLRAAGRTDAVNKLLRELDRNGQQRDELLGVLRKMADSKEIVVEIDGLHWTLIKLPHVITEPESEDTDVPAQRGRKLTTYPCDAVSHELPSTLPDHLVGPVLTTYTPEAAKKAIMTMADLVWELLCEFGKSQMGRGEVLDAIHSVVQTLHPDLDAGLVDTRASQVLHYLIGRQQLDCGPDDPNDPAAVFSLQLPEKPAVPAMDKDQAIEQLITAVEDKQRQIDTLKKQLEEMKTTHVSAATLEQLTGRLEGALGKNTELQRELDAANESRAASDREHAEALRRLNAEHQAALDKQRQELTAAADAERSQLESELTQHTSSVTPELAERMRKLGIDL